VTHKLLPKDLWATFDTRDAAETYMHQLEGLLAQGIVPQALLERASPKTEIWTVRRCRQALECSTRIRMEMIKANHILDRMRR
jgi:hypothetical protein